ncbi:hypothetical protein [Moorena producens]|nr:hypothetical protein [Moorena producens]
MLNIIIYDFGYRRANRRYMMAVLRLEDGTTYTELSDIAQELAPLKVQLNHWSVGENPEIHSLLEQDTLSDIEKETVLQALASSKIHPTLMA